MSTLSSFRLGIDINCLCCNSSDRSSTSRNKKNNNDKKVTSQIPSSSLSLSLSSSLCKNCKVCRDTIENDETNSSARKNRTTAARTTTNAATNRKTTWVVHTSSVKIYRNVEEDACRKGSSEDNGTTNNNNKKENVVVRQIGIFVPPSIVSLIEDQNGYCKHRKPIICSNNNNSKYQSDECKKCCIREIPCNRNDAYAISLASLLAKIHPSLSCLDVECIILVTPPPTTQYDGENNDMWRKSQSTACIDLLIINIPPSMSCHVFIQLFDDVNGEGMVAVPKAVIKVLPISDIKLEYASTNKKREGNNNNETEKKMMIQQQLKIPSCPVCLHRIDPLRLGLLKTKVNKLCSEYCETTMASSTACENQTFLTPWSSPAHCDACAIILEYYKFVSSMSSMEYATYLSLSPQNNILPTTANTEQNNSNTFIMQEYPSFDEQNQTIVDRSQQQSHPSSSQQRCFFKCKMQETLWVCLTCGIVGCGRYSCGHADKHYHESGHEFSLELATHRIWDYAADGFAQRTDLLNCPFHRIAFFQELNNNGSGNSNNAALSHDANALRSSPGSVSNMNSNKIRGGFENEICHNSSNVTTEDNEDDSILPSTPSNCTNYSQLYSNSTTTNTTARRHHNEPNVKKTMMIGEEYEVLLQSALEDQSQHYESEISRLHTQITADKLDSKQIPKEEQIEIQSLENDISTLRLEIKHYSQVLLDFQGQEAGYRATCQQLLQNQKESTDEFTLLQNKLGLMQEERTIQIEDLQQQIEDLTTNLEMRDRILAHHQELSQAQIVGSTSVVSPSKKSDRGNGKKSRRFQRNGRKK